MMNQVPYPEFEGFEAVYLEGSYLLDVQETDTEIKFIVELVLTEDHPQYAPPLPNEQYCYRHAEIAFSSIKTKKWIHKRMKPISDPSGPPDYGNIDAFFGSGERHRIEGEWGEVWIEGPPPRLVIGE